MDRRQPGSLVSGAFKLRGATNALLSLPKDALARGVVTASTGNHGRALAYAARILGVRAVVCLSNLVPVNKVQAVRDLGAEVRILGQSQDEAMREVASAVEHEGLAEIPPFDHPTVVAGQGTLGLEILADRPAPSAVLIPLSGGGLAAALCILARDRSGPAICFQHLSIPELDDRLDTPSARAFTDTPIWKRSLAETSWDYYLGSAWRRGADDVPVLAAPARATDLGGLPPALINTMEFDPLRDEGLLYAMQLLRAGVSVEVHSYPGTFHGSAIFPARVSRQQARDSEDALRRALR